MGNARLYCLVSSTVRHCDGQSSTVASRTQPGIGWYQAQQTAWSQEESSRATSTTTQHCNRPSRAQQKFVSAIPSVVNHPAEQLIVTTKTFLPSRQTHSCHVVEQQIAHGRPNRSVGRDGKHILVMLSNDKSHMANQSAASVHMANTFLSYC